MSAPRLRAAAAALGLLLCAGLGLSGRAGHGGHGAPGQPSDDAARRPCPAACHCLGDLLDCSRRRLVHLPDPLPAWVARLDLSHNRLSSIQTSSLSHLQHLREVKLNNNELETIPDLGPVSANIRQLSLVAENFTKNSNLSWQLSEYLRGNWNKEFEDLMDTLTSQIISLNATRLELPTANAILNMLKQAFSYIKEWAGMGVLLSMMLLAIVVCLWCFYRIRKSQKSQAAMLVQAFAAVEAGQSPQA